MQKDAVKHNYLRKGLKKSIYHWLTSCCYKLSLKMNSLWEKNYGIFTSGTQQLHHYNSKEVLTGNAFWEIKCVPNLSTKIMIKCISKIFIFGIRTLRFKSVIQLPLPCHRRWLIWLEDECPRILFTPDIKVWDWATAEQVITSILARVLSPARH